MNSIIAATQANNTALIIFVVILSITGLGLIIYLFIRRDKNYLKHWIEIGQELGIDLSHDKGKDRLKLIGIYKGINVAVRAVFIQSSISQTNTEMYFDKGINTDIYITKKTGGFWQRNNPSIIFEDEEFDKAFFVGSKTPEKAISFLQPEIRKLLVNNSELFEKGSLYIDDNVIKWLGRNKSTATFHKQVLDLFVNIYNNI